MGGPWNQPKSKKVRSGHLQKHEHEKNRKNMKQQKNMKKRDHHQSMRIQAKFDVFQQFNDRKNKKAWKNGWSKNMTNQGLGLILGGQKSSKMMTFSKHENHEQSMAGAANLRLEAAQKSLKIKSKKNKKTRKSNHPKKHENWGVKGVIARSE